MEMVDSDELKPQQALEKILQLEIEIAEKIAEAKENAEKKVTTTQDNTTDVKNRIIEDARTERDHTIEAGIADARQHAEERIETAKVEAKKFLEVGKKYQEAAAEHVLDLVINTDKREDK